MSELSYWRKCTTCKSPIAFGQKYWVCSVSTCNRIRTDLVFCDLRCFDAHIPVMNHRDAGAFERKAPLTATQASPATPKQALPAQKPVLHSSALPAHHATHQRTDDEILVVVSKVKKYIKDQSGMNTSDAVMDVLSEKIREITESAVKSALASGRKTVMERDF